MYQKHNTMKFGEYLKSQQRSEWKLHYIDYDRLKRMLRGLNHDNFLAAVYGQIQHLNQFVQSRQKNGESVAGLEHFIMTNYMALFKIIKKHDKRWCRQHKAEFLRTIERTEFYRMYIEMPRPRMPTQLVIFDKVVTERRGKTSKDLGSAKVQ